VQGYIDGGYVPEAVANYLCLLGWSPKDNREKLTLQEVASLFELEKVNRRNAAFDPDKCFWLNGQYIASMPLERFRELSLPFMRAAGLPVDAVSPDYLDHVLAGVKEKVKLLKDVPPWTAYFFGDDYPFDEEAVAKTLRAPGASERLTQLASRLEAIPPADWGPEQIEAAFKGLAAEHAVKTAVFIHPARVAVSGRSVGPSLYHMLMILGQEKVLNRLRSVAAEYI
jgi:glutamyl-tRNA synthetase